MNGRRPRSYGRLALFLRKCERRYLRKALQKHHGHNSALAKELGISRRALYDKLRAHGLDQEAAGLRAENGVKGPRRVERG